MQIHEIGEEEGLPFLCMEYVDGTSLDKLLARWHAQGSVGLAPAQAAQLVETVARATHHAHQHGVLHRDLKPGNILLSPNPRSETGGPNVSFEPKITDFGLAKLLDGGSASTQSGALLGTPSYMAPEQAGDTSLLSPATDVYGLGVVLYELLTGRVPFQGSTVVETLEQVRSVEPPPPVQLQPNLPRDLQTICLSCLRKDPARRYASAADLADDLRRFRAGEPILARPTSWLERGGKWVKRRPAVAALLAGIILITLAALALVTWQWRETAQALSDKELERHKAEESAAGRLIALARSHWLANDLEQARACLGQCPLEFRNRDWRHLQRLCHVELLRLDSSAKFRALAWSADGQRIIGVTFDDEICVWDAGSGALDKRITWRERTELPALEFVLPRDGHDQLYMLTPGSLKAEPKLYDRKIVVRRVSLADGNHEVVFTRSFAYQSGGALSADGKRLAAFAPLEDGSRAVQILALPAGDNLMTFGRTRDPSSPVLVFSPDGRRLARAYSGLKKARVEVWDVFTGKLLRTIDLAQTPTYGARTVQFSPDGQFLGCAIRSGEIWTSVHIWDIDADRETLTLRATHVGGMMLFAFSPQGRQVAWVGSRHEINLSDAVSGKELLTLRGHTTQLAQIAFSPDGRRLASCGQDRTLRIWDVRPLESD